MTLRRPARVAAAVLAAGIAPGIASGDPRQIDWTDLRPVADADCDRWYQLSQSLDICAGVPVDTGYHRCAARTVQLDGPVRIAGYAHPVRMEFRGVQTFMLAPAAAACPHPPAPMANQLILVDYPPGTDMSFDPVFVTGRLEPELSLHGMMQIRYRMTATRVEPAAIPDVIQ